MQKHENGSALGWIIEVDTGRGGRIGWASRAYVDTNEEAQPESDEVFANAHLIAAAPDLLAALRTFIDALENNRGMMDCETVARAAIQRATQL